MPRDIAPTANLPTSTVHFWKYKWDRGHSWRPWRKAIHGAHNRIFTDEEELELLDVIIKHYVAPGKMFNLHDFRALALKKYEAVGEIRRISFARTISSNVSRRDTESPPDASICVAEPVKALAQGFKNAQKRCNNFSNPRMETGLLTATRPHGE
jgi:hypothetical protein